MKAKKSKNFKIAVVAMALAAIIGSLSLLADAIWNEDEAVHIKAADIESSTLIIGTHLIHLSALTDSIYGVATSRHRNRGKAIFSINPNWPRAPGLT